MKLKTAMTMLIATLVITSLGCCGSDSKAGAFLAKDQKYYDSLGIGREPAPREDGIRSTGKEGTYEWWYIDAEYS